MTGVGQGLQARLLDDDLALLAAAERPLLHPLQGVGNFFQHLLLVVQRFVILLIRDGIYQSRKLLPHILAKQLLTGLCSEWPGLRIDVDVTPPRIEEHEPVRQIVQDARQTLPGGL